MLKSPGPHELDHTRSPIHLDPRAGGASPAAVARWPHPQPDGSARGAVVAHLAEVLAVLAVLALYVTVMLLLSATAAALPLFGAQ